MYPRRGEAGGAGAEAQVYFVRGGPAEAVPLLQSQKEKQIPYGNDKDKEAKGKKAKAIAKKAKQRQATEKTV